MSIIKRISKIKNFFFLFSGKQLWPLALFLPLRVQVVTVTNDSSGVGKGNSWKASWKNLDERLPNGCLKGNEKSCTNQFSLSPCNDKALCVVESMPSRGQEDVRGAGPRLAFVCWRW